MCRICVVLDSDDAVDLILSIALFWPVFSAFCVILCMCTMQSHKPNLRGDAEKPRLQPAQPHTESNEYDADVKDNPVSFRDSCCSCPLA